MNFLQTTVPTSDIGKRNTLDCLKKERESKATSTPKRNLKETLEVRKGKERYREGREDYRRYGSSQLKCICLIGKVASKVQKVQVKREE